MLLLFCPLGVLPPRADEFGCGAEQRLPFVHRDGVTQRLDQHHQMTVLRLHLIHKGWCICTSVGDGTDQPALRRRVVQQVTQCDALRLVDNRLGELVEDRLRRLCP